MDRYEIMRLWERLKGCPCGEDLEDGLQNLLFNDRCEVLLGYSSGFVSVLVPWQGRGE